MTSQLSCSLERINTEYFVLFCFQASPRGFAILKEVTRPSSSWYTHENGRRKPPWTPNLLVDILGSNIPASLQVKVKTSACIPHPAVLDCHAIIGCLLVNTYGYSKVFAQIYIIAFHFYLENTEFKLKREQECPRSPLPQLWPLSDGRNSRAQNQLAPCHRET